MKANKHKKIDRRLRVLKLYLEGSSEKEIVEKVDFSLVWVKKLLKEYHEKGLYEYARNKYGGNHRSMSFAEEESILIKFDERSSKGEIVTVSEIKKAFDEKRGKDTGRGYIYMLLKRHNDNAGWHKSGILEIPENIVIMHIPAYTPEMNPIEQVWDEIREKCFVNQLFATLNKVIDKLCDAIQNLKAETISSITFRPWLREFLI
jgi:transposase